MQTKSTRALSVPAAEASTVLQIGTTEEGVYRLTPADLRRSGMDPATVDPRRLQLHSGGTPMAIHVVGEGDGVLNEEDRIFFYATAVDSKFTNTNIYWLTVAEDAGLRMDLKSSTPLSEAESPTWFPAYLHAEENTTYWQSMIGDGDRWFWGARLGPNTAGLETERAYSIPLQHIDTGDGTVSVRVALHGYTGLEHRTQLYLNDTLIDDQTWQGQVPFIHDVSVAHSLLHNGLHNGDNEVRIVTVETGASVDQVYVNWMELGYRASYVAEGNELHFGVAASGEQQIRVAGFEHSDIHLWEVSDPLMPVRLTDLEVTLGANSYAVRFAAQAESGSRYVAFTPDHYRTPDFVRADAPSSWRSSENGADYIIITHADFVSSVTPLADRRRARGLRVAVVEVQDIYDEFSHGRFDPRAIRDFLSHTYVAWQRPAPTYVLLVGDANQDYKDNLQTNTPNYVPSWNFNSAISGEVSSDDWFVQVDGDDSLPDMRIGRLAAQSAAEAQTMVDKLIAYEENPPDAPWNTNALLVADDDIPDFQALSETLAGHLPGYYTVNRVYDLAENPTQQIIDAINMGSLLVNYTGHGEYFGWGVGGAGQGSIFHKEDVAQLHNEGRLPVVTVANCLNGFFAGPQGNASLAEVLQRHPDGGAVAVWAPSGLGYPSGHAVLMEAFYEALFQGEHRELGAAIHAAKQTTQAQSSYWADLTQTFILFGDPAMEVGTSDRHLYYLPQIRVDAAD